MASSLDISPALGHGIVTAQGIAGGYDAIDDRRQWGVGRQEGATTSTAYKVTQRAAGANLSIDVATDGGHFLVQGDDVAWQSLYLIPATALNANLTLADPPDITNPRVDFVVLEARDDAHTLDGITRGRVYVISGTPTSGASVVDSAAYIASKPTLPASTALLAEVLVTANATSIVTANIRDRRTSALGAASRFRQSGGSIAIATGAFAPIAVSLRVETGPTGRIDVSLNGSYNINGANNYLGVRLMMDGATIPLANGGGEIFHFGANVSASQDGGVIGVWELEGIAPGSHVFQIDAIAQSSGAVLHGTGGTFRSVVLRAQEDLRGWN